MEFVPVRSVVSLRPSTKIADKLVAIDDKLDARAGKFRRNGNLGLEWLRLCKLGNGHFQPGKFGSDAGELGSVKLRPSEK